MKITAQDFEETLDVELTPEDEETLEASIGFIEIKSNVSHNYNSLGCSMSCDVPRSVGWLKTLKFLYNKVMYVRQGQLKVLTNGTSNGLGNDSR